MTFKNLKRKELKVEEAREVLKKFEPGESFHKFRNTAIYHSFKHNYNLYLQKSAK